MATTFAVPLQRLRGDIEPITEPELAVHADEAPPDNAAVDLRPTRQYQMLLVLASFMMIFNVIGINSIYALFQEFYTSSSTTISDAEGQDALVSLVGTIGSGLTWSGSIFVNPLIARTERPMLITLSGAFIMSTGIILASFSTKLWHLFLTQGLLYGLGSSMYYFPLMSLTPVYFNQHRGAAMGVVLSGAGVGGLVLSPVFHLLLTRFGIRWALRILGLWTFAVGIPVSSVLRKTQGPSGLALGRTTMSMAIVKRGTFIMQSIGAFLQAAGNTVPTYFLTTYSVSVLSYSSGTGSILLALNTGVNTVARIAMGILADRVGRQNTLVLSVIFSGVSVVALWYDSSRSRFIAFVVFYGVMAGGYNALVPTTITELYGVQNYSNVNSSIYFIRGLGAICGAPIAGAILGSYNRSSSLGPDAMMAGLEALKARYNDVAIFAGLLLLAAGVCVSYVRWLDARDKGEWKWRA